MRDARADMHVGIANPRGGENVLGIPGACATRNLGIWQEAHIIQGVVLRMSHYERAFTLTVVAKRRNDIEKLYIYFHK